MGLPKNVANMSRQHQALFEELRRRLLEEATGTARATLAELTRQRAALKGAHRRALDMVRARRRARARASACTVRIRYDVRVQAARLGMSNAVIRLIERRTTGDKIIVYGGLLILLLLVGLLWWYR